MIYSQREKERRSGGVLGACLKRKTGLEMARSKASEQGKLEDASDKPPRTAIPAAAQKRKKRGAGAQPAKAAPRGPPAAGLPGALGSAKVAAAQ